MIKIPNMSQYNKIILNTFKYSLNEITDYLNELSPSTALNFATALNQQLPQITATPFIYPPYENDDYFRKMVVIGWRYIVFYTVDEKNKTVILYDIFHQSRNISDILLKKFPKGKTFF